MEETDQGDSILMTEYVEYRWSSPTYSHPDIANAILSLINDRYTGGKICELGCGSGWVCHRLAEKGFETTGVDLSESGIEVAKSINVEGARFVRESIDAGLPDRIGLVGECDIVMSNDVIEHLYRRSDLVEAAKGLLKPGGVMITATPYHGYVKNLAIAVLGKTDAHFDPLWDGGHIKFFSENTFSKLLQSHGFLVSDFKHVGRTIGL